MKSKRKSKRQGKPCSEARWYGHTGRCGKDCLHCSGNRTHNTRKRLVEAKEQHGTR